MSDYLSSSIKQFEYYKSLGESTFDQLSEDQLFYQVNNVSNNSIAILVKHLHGNMMSRWTNFLTEDGEKAWRKRDEEFKNDLKNKEEILAKWQEGWNCLFHTLNSLSEDDMYQEIFIRNMGHSVTEAINRQLCHYSYHVGQIVFIGKILSNEKWQSLSIPKGKSKAYNAEKFAKEKRKEHFTDDL